MKAKKKWAEDLADLVTECENLPENIAERHDDITRAYLAGFEKAKEEALKHVVVSTMAVPGQPYIERRFVRASDIEKLGEEEV